MSSLNEIRKRINAVNNTSKITQAMKLVATAKVARQKADYLKISNYISGLYDLLIQLTRSTTYSSIFISKRNANKNLHIVISSTLGLCGSYNINVCKHLINNLGPNDDIIVIGNKASSYLQSRGLKERIIAKYQFNDKFASHIELLPLTSYIIDNFISIKYDKVFLSYTKYMNSLNFVPTTLQLLPLDFKLFKPDEKNINYEINELNDNKQIIDFIPNHHGIIESLIPFFTSSMIIASLTESRLCEFSSRRNAMDSATENAKELIENLKLEYNQVRQEKITQEINEIVAGS